MRPLRSSSLKWSSVAQCGTRFEFAISTRGVSECVRNTPTGFPDWTQSVSSASRSRNDLTMRSKLSQSRAARPTPPYTTSSWGFSATSGSRLFISIRSGASVSQLRAEIFGPRGARIVRALSRRVAMSMWSSSGTSKPKAGFEDSAQGLLDGLGEIGIPGRGLTLITKIAAHCKLHLYRVDSFLGSAVGAGDPTASETTIDHVRQLAGSANSRDALTQGRVACFAVVRADVEHRQFAGEQRDITDLNVKHYAIMQTAQPRELFCERCMIRLEVKLLAPLDLFRARCCTAPIERAAIKSLDRDEAGSCLTRIERRAGRIAVYIDDRA